MKSRAGPGTRAIPGRTELSYDGVTVARDRVEGSAAERPGSAKREERGAGGRRPGAIPEARRSDNIGSRWAVAGGALWTATTCSRVWCRVPDPAVPRIALSESPPATTPECAERGVRGFLSVAN